MTQPVEETARGLPENPPDSVGNWMKDLPSIEEAEPTQKVPPQKEEEQPPKEAPKQETPDKPTAEAPKVDKEAPKPADKKEPAKEEQTDEEKWPRSASDWEKFRAKRKESEQKLQNEIKARETRLAEADKRVKAMETQLEELRQKSASAPSPELTAQIEQYKKQIEDYSNRLAVTEITSHPKFIAYFKRKVDEQLDLAKEIVGGGELGDSLATTLALPDSEYKQLKIEEIFNDLTPLQQNRFGPVINELRRIDKEKQAEIAKAQENRAKMQEEEKGNAQKQFEKNKELFSNVLKDMQDPEKGSPHYQLREGDEEWNAQIKANIEEAQKVLLGHSDKKPQDIVRAALNAAAYPMLLKSYQADLKSRDDRISELEAQVKALSAAQPTTGKETATGEEINPQPKIHRGMSPMEASAAFMRGIHQQE